MELFWPLQVYRKKNSREFFEKKSHDYSRIFSKEKRRLKIIQCVVFEILIGAVYCHLHRCQWDRFFGRKWEGKDSFGKIAASRSNAVCGRLGSNYVRLHPSVSSLIQKFKHF